MPEYEMTLDEEIRYLRWWAVKHSAAAVELCERVVSGRYCLEDMILLDSDAELLLEQARQASELADGYEQRRQAEIRQWVREAIAVGLRPTAEERGATLQ